jgi:hypothetical protein
MTGKQEAEAYRYGIPGMCEEARQGHRRKWGSLALDIAHWRQPVEYERWIRV